MNLGRRRAKNALDRIKALDGKPKGFKEKYRSYVDRLGPAIVMNGLGQALATERAAAGSSPKSNQQCAHQELYTNLKQWLCGDGDVYSSKADLLNAIVNNDEALYLRAQAEALAWLDWHKKFCRAYIEAGDGGAE